MADADPPPPAYGDVDAVKGDADEVGGGAGVAPGTIDVAVKRAVHSDRTDATVTVPITPTMQLVLKSRYDPRLKEKYQYAMSAEINVRTPALSFSVRYHRITVYAKRGFLVCHGAGQDDVEFNMSFGLLEKLRDANFRTT